MHLSFRRTKGPLTSWHLTPSSICMLFLYSLTMGNLFFPSPLLHQDCYFSSPQVLIASLSSTLTHKCIPAFCPLVLEYWFPVSCMFATQSPCIVSAAVSGHTPYPFTYCWSQEGLHIPCCLMAQMCLSSPSSFLSCQHNQHLFCIHWVLSTHLLTPGKEEKHQYPASL